jgi:hypothetical protein
VSAISKVDGSASTETDGRKARPGAFPAGCVGTGNRKRGLRSRERIAVDGSDPAAFGDQGVAGRADGVAVDVRPRVAPTQIRKIRGRGADWEESVIREFRAASLKTLLRRSVDKLKIGVHADGPGNKRGRLKTYRLEAYTTVPRLQIKENLVV